MMRNEREERAFRKAGRIARRYAQDGPDAKALIERAIRRIVASPHIEVEEPPYPGWDWLVGSVDLRFERYPLPKEERDFYTAEYLTKGVAAKHDGQWILIHRGDPDVVPITEEEAVGFTQLPSFWKDQIHVFTR